MAENAENEDIEAKDDRVGMDYKQGPNPAPGGTVDVEADAPPYEGRTTGRGDNKNETAESVERQMAGSEAGVAGQTSAPGVESPAQEHELSDSEPHADKGVGESSNSRAEDMQDKDGKEPGRHDLPPDDTGRTAGTSDKRDVTGVG